MDAPRRVKVDEEQLPLVDVFVERVCVELEAVPLVAVVIFLRNGLGRVYVRCARVGRRFARRDRFVVLVHVCFRRKANPSAIDGILMNSLVVYIFAILSNNIFNNLSMFFGNFFSPCNRLIRRALSKAAINAL